VDGTLIEFEFNSDCRTWRVALEGGSSSARGVRDPTGKEKLGVEVGMVLVLVLELVWVLVLVF
jgi:hypothetical protein